MQNYESVRRICEDTRWVFGKGLAYHFGKIISKPESKEMKVLGSPLKGDFVISSLFSWNPRKIDLKAHPTRPHYGIDIAPSYKFPNQDLNVYSPVSGRLAIIGQQYPGAGEFLRIDHGDYQFYLFHLKKNSFFVSKSDIGKKISVGQPLAIMGNTGYEGMGVHLHYEVRFQNKHIKPDIFLFCSDLAYDLLENQIE